ncbi:MAG: RND family transporter [Trueperaceae bacterium]|nr:MAG: RND family transporter [Trueperaceae bacterium]
MHAFVRSFTAWVIDHAWITIIGAVSVTAAFFVVVLTIGLGFESDFKKFLPDDDPSVQLLRRAEETYGSQDLFLIALVAEDTIFKPSTLKKFKEMEARFAELTGVDEVRGPATASVIYGTQDSLVVEEAMEVVPSSPEEVEIYRQRVLGDRNIRGTLISEDERAGAMILTLDPFEVDIPSLVPEVEAIVAEYEGPEEIFPAGEPVLRVSVSASMLRDLRLLIPFVVLVMFVVIYLSFRSLRAIFLPLFTVLASTVWAVGTMALSGSPITPFSVLMPVMLIVIGAANGIHILNRYYEEVGRQAGTGSATPRSVLLDTMEEMATPVVLTSLTTAVGFLGLITSFLWPQRAFGVFTAVGILYAMILSLTLIPAVLSRFPLPQVRGSYERGWLADLLAALARAVRRGPVVTIGIGVVILVIFALAIPRIKVETRTEEFLGESHPVVQALNVMEERFGGSRQLSIEIDTGRRDGLKDPEVLRKLVELESYLLEKPEVGDVASVATIVRQLNETLHASDPAFYAVPEDPRLAAQLFILYGGDPSQLFLGDYSKGEMLARMENASSQRLGDIVDDIRLHLSQLFGGEGGVEAEVVGMTQAFARLTETMVPSQIKSLLASLVAVGLIVSLLLRSFVAGLLSLIPLILTLVIEFGVMSYAGVPLDIATLMLGSIAIGVGIDYVIHFLSRYRQEIRGGQEPAEAFERTLRTAGKGITFNAVALMLGFIVLLASSFQGLFNFGLLLGLTMLIASLSSFTVVPAILLITKPAFLKRKEPLAGVQS